MYVSVILTREQTDGLRPRWWRVVVDVVVVVVYLFTSWSVSGRLICGPLGPAMVSHTARCSVRTSTVTPEGLEAPVHLKHVYSFDIFLNKYNPQINN